jgi:hypothetical protein
VIHNDTRFFGTLAKWPLAAHPSCHLIKTVFILTARSVSHINNVLARTLTEYLENFSTPSFVSFRYSATQHHFQVPNQTNAPSNNIKVIFIFFWILTPSSLVDRSKIFGGNYLLHLQAPSIFFFFFFYLWGRREPRLSHFSFRGRLYSNPYFSSSLSSRGASRQTA